MIRQAAKEIVYQYGAGILLSEEFIRGYDQIHHHVTTVAEHSLHVAVISVMICLILGKLHIHTKERQMVEGALCHDIGILDRYDKYDSNRECYRKHPDDSAEIAKTLVDNYDATVDNIIRRHMWPATPIPPKCREGFIITLADKIASIREVALRRNSVRG